MNFDGNFKDLGAFDITEIKNRIQSFKAEWDLNQSRQERYKLFHGDSKNIFVTDIDATWDGFGYPLVKHNIDERLNELTKPIVARLENMLGGKVGKCLFINLPAGKKVKPHVDLGYYLTSVHRCHIPIQTHQDISFTLGGESIHMKEGMGYEINNTRQHSVDNDSAVDRIHLLIDIMPPEVFKSMNTISTNTISNAPSNLTFL
jgi:hypothetical protein